MTCLPTLLQSLIWSATYVVINLKLVTSFWNYVFLALLKPRTKQCQACLVRLMALLTNLLTDSKGSNVTDLRKGSGIHLCHKSDGSQIRKPHLGVSYHSLKIKKENPNQAKAALSGKGITHTAGLCWLIPHISGTRGKCSNQNCSSPVYWEVTREGWAFLHILSS